MSTCSSCNAPIEFVLTASGKQMPMDPPKDCDRCKGTGRIEAFTSYGPKPGGEPLAVTEHPARDCEACKGTGRVHLTHFATCPNAAQHRKKQAK